MPVSPPAAIVAPADVTPIVPVNRPALTANPWNVNVGIASTSTFPIGIDVPGVSVFIPTAPPLLYASSSFSIAARNDGTSADTATAWVNGVVPIVPVIWSVSR